MDVVTREEFLLWAAEVGVGFDPRYPDSGCLSLLPPREHARFWVLPHDHGAWPHFVATVLGGLDDWTAGHLWPRSGRWPEAREAESYEEGVRGVVLRGAGVPAGWAGAVRLTRGEDAELVAVLYAYLAFGWCVDDDLFFLPDHGRQLLQTDHHDVVHMECRSEERVMKLVTYMAGEGYELPVDLPDSTFKRPAWMGGAPGHGRDEQENRQEAR